MNGEICVPKTALELPGEAGGEGVAPGEGEEVEFSGKGKVRIEGGNAYLTPSEINGTPVTAEGGSPNPEDGETGMDDLEAEARGRSPMAEQVPA